MSDWFSGDYDSRTDDNEAARHFWDAVRWCAFLIAIGFVAGVLV